MRETTDTSSRFLGDLPDGPNIFKVVNIEKFYSPAEFFVFHLNWSGGDGKQTFFANMMGPLLRTLGCEETSPNVFEWDTDVQFGKRFKATVSHAPDKKDATKIRQHMGAFEKLDENEPPF